MQVARTTGEQLYDLVQRSRIIQIGTYEGANIFIKDETSQSVGSFKIRGALYKILEIASTTPELLQAGLVTASAGNHAQGVALAAAYHNVPAHIYLPATTAPGKVKAIQMLGGTIHFVEGGVDEALEQAEKIASDTGAVFIHPFDDKSVIAGQATIGDEIAEDHRSFDTVFVPVGGGGLLAGICTSLLAQAYRDTRIFGVQLEGCDAFSRSIAAREIVELHTINDLADGTAVKRAGQLTLRSVLESPSFSGMITVKEAELGKALLRLDDLTEVRAEPAAGLAFAGLRKHLRHIEKPTGNHLAVITGRHRDPERFARLTNTALARAVEK